MDILGSDGKVLKNAKPEAVSEASAQPGQTEPKTIFIGFRGEGAEARFCVEIPAEVGYHAIQGHLLEAQQWLRMTVARQQQMEAGKKIVKPKGWRGFNAFK